MKAYGIGLIILLAAFAISLYPAYINYNWIMNQPTTQAEYTARYEELKTATLIGFVTAFVAILGVLVFLVEFIKHEHSHEHELSAPRISPPSL
jgi:glucan phosphoethanolaminetransferase (alkaline phosphatase superfamily)